MSMRIHPIIQIVLFFAIIGFIEQLIRDPIQTLLIIGMTALLLFFVNNFLKTGRFLPGKTSPGKKSSSGTKHIKHAPRTQKKSTDHARKQYPFQVIEGQKGKEDGKNSEQRSKTYH
ncbi:hypothetical protein LOK74_10770 [Brevibacillus humidisoli]|uniref:hypothetical protein n=1 Tax=Brevibacillus humidisoli TaxID=2895522 RepID=UPI001E398B34|nr:hypothetical protein [Brevibacillus humidisoli]UFJ42937.1 hypothetical protein LOK74_10770 [Brevibacillus humidisoli]